MWLSCDWNYIKYGLGVKLILIIKFFTYFTFYTFKKLKVYQFDYHFIEFIDIFKRESVIEKNKIFTSFNFNKGEKKDKNKVGFSMISNNN